MLPDADDFPAIRPQAAEVALIAVAVGAEVVAPELRKFMFPRGQPPTVPKISVHEDGELFLWENDVGTAGQGADVATEFQPFGAKLPLHQFFQRAVLQFHALHGASALGGREVVSHWKNYFVVARRVFTRALIFARTVESFFFASSVNKAVCATASLIGLNSVASRERHASL